MSTLLLSIHPRFADLIEEGRKVVEFRRRFPNGVNAGQIIFYVTDPAREIRLVAKISGVQRASPAQLWNDFHCLAGVERDAFDAYFAGRQTGVAILLREVKRLPAPLPLAGAKLRRLGFRPPQSVVRIAPASSLLKLVSGAGRKSCARCRA
jgi:predicted transcriptional regulator